VSRQDGLSERETRQIRQPEGCMPSIPVTTPDGLTISAGEWGNPAGREIVFVHGLSQCALAWSRQLAAANLPATSG
jgi:hypothetical protein